MKKLYRISWETKSIETATLIDEHNMNPGATEETWLCKDDKDRRFTCAKGSYEFSELDAWCEYKKELEEGLKQQRLALIDAQKDYEENFNLLLMAQQKIVDHLQKQMDHTNES